MKRTINENQTDKKTDNVNACVRVYMCVCVYVCVNQSV